MNKIKKKYEKSNNNKTNIKKEHDIILKKNKELNISIKFEHDKNINKN